MEHIQKHGINSKKYIWNNMELSLNGLKKTYYYHRTCSKYFIIVVQGEKTDITIVHVKNKQTHYQGTCNKNMILSW